MVERKNKWISVGCIHIFRPLYYNASIYLSIHLSIYHVCTNVSRCLFPEVYVASKSAICESHYQHVIFDFVASF